MLAETLGADPEVDAGRFEEVLAETLEQELVSDAVIAKSQGERNALWEVRDDVLDLFSLGPIIPFDISVTIDRMPGFVRDVQSAMSALTAPICVIFGHLGDSNLHLILGSRDPEEFDHGAIESLVYGIVEQHQGSVSAEHGVGLSKRDHLSCSRNSEELALMRQMKNMLDPSNILNPGKIFAAA